MKDKTWCEHIEFKVYEGDEKEYWLFDGSDYKHCLYKIANDWKVCPICETRNPYLDPKLTSPS